MPKVSESDKKIVRKKSSAKKVSASAKTKAQLQQADKIAVRSKIKEELSAVTFLKVWLDGWKKSFVLRGRSSKFELWCFLLLNSIITVTIQLKCCYIMSSRFLVYAAQQSMDIVTIEKYITCAEIVFYLVFVVSLFPLGALLIRRMHDLGKLAWQDCLEPAFMGMVVVWVLFLTLCYLAETDYIYTVILLATCFVTILYATAYYVLRFLVMTMFYKGDEGQNKYGLSKYGTEEYDNLALDLSCFYFLFIFTVVMLALIAALV